MVQVFGDLFCKKNFFYVFKKSRSMLFVRIGIFFVEFFKYFCSDKFKKFSNSKQKVK